MSWRKGLKREQIFKYCDRMPLEPYNIRVETIGIAKYNYRSSQVFMSHNVGDIIHLNIFKHLDGDIFTYRKRGASSSIRYNLGDFNYFKSFVHYLPTKYEIIGNMKIDIEEIYEISKFIESGYVL